MLAKLVLVSLGPEAPFCHQSCSGWKPTGGRCGFFCGVVYFDLFELFERDRADVGSRSATVNLHIPDHMMPCNTSPYSKRQEASPHAGEVKRPRLDPCASGPVAKSIAECVASGVPRSCYFNE